MPRKHLFAFLAATSLAGIFLYFRWSTAIRQPLDFSHATHVRKNISCDSCHSIRTSENLPPPSLCLDCHKTMHTGSGVRWVRIYRVAPDILFTHAKHTDVSCAVCHPAMTSARRWIHETRYKMDFCMDCHAQEGAKNECGTCHKNR